MIAPTATSPGLGAVTAVAPLSTRSAQRPHLTPAGATEQSNDPEFDLGAARRRPSRGGCPEDDP
jgi:hypothetical protein